MSLQNLPYVYLPGLRINASAFGPSFSSTNFILDAGLEKAGCVIQIPKAATISKIWFRTSTVTTGATVDVRVETVSLTTGAPTGTLWATDTRNSQVIAATDDNILFGVSLLANATVSRGDYIAVVIENPNTSPGNMIIASFSDAENRDLMPSGWLYTTSWAAINSAQPVLGLELTDGSFLTVPGLVLLKNATTVTYNSSTNPNHRALRFRSPVPLRVSGFSAWLDMDGDVEFMIVADNWDGDSANALAKVTIDADLGATVNGGIGDYLFTSDVDLAANTTYRLVMRPTTTTSFSCYEFTVETNDHFGALSGGKEFYLSTANNPTGSGSWTDTTTTRPFIDLIVSGFDDGVSAGGLAANPVKGFIA